MTYREDSFFRGTHYLFKSLKNLNEYPILGLFIMSTKRLHIFALKISEESHRVSEASVWAERETERKVDIIIICVVSKLGRVCLSEWPRGKQTAYIHLPVHFPIHTLAVAFRTREMRCNLKPRLLPSFFRPITPLPPLSLARSLPYFPLLSCAPTRHPPPPSTTLWPSCGQEVMINNYNFFPIFSE